VAQGAHLELMNMGSHVIELNMTDDNEYNIGGVLTDNGRIKTGPPDCFSYANYTHYQRDILDKRGGNRKLSLDIEQYDDVARTDENLLELGLSRWPWDESCPYESHFIGDREWILIKGAQDDEVDAACWIDDNTILSLRMFNVSESDSLATPGSVTTRSNHQARMDA
jgi:hypothetical protein